MHGLQIAADSFRAKWHRAVDQRVDPGGASSLNIETEVRWNFDRRFDVSALEVRLIEDQRFLDEIGGSPELLEISAALGTLILIQYGERKIVDVSRDPKPEHQHQQGGSQQAESEPDRITH